MKRHLPLLLACLALPCTVPLAEAAAAVPPPDLSTLTPGTGAAPAGAGAPAPAPAVPIIEALPTTEPRAGEPEVKHTVIEGETTRIDELRVRGVAQRIVVTTKGRSATHYEIITGDGSRDLSDGANTSRGATGKRVWRVLDF